MPNSSQDQPVSEGDIGKVDHLQDELNPASDGEGEMRDSNQPSGSMNVDEDEDKKPAAKASTGVTGIAPGDGSEDSELTPRTPERRCPDAPNQPISRGRKRKSMNVDDDGIDEEDGDEEDCSSVDTPSHLNKRSSSTPMDGDDAQCSVASTPRSVPKITCQVDGCEKLRCKQGFCQRHFKDPSAPIRSGSSEYKQRYCVIDGCERLRAKGSYCFRHSKDPEAPLRNKSEGYDRRKPCIVDDCDRLQVKGGYCSRHFKDKEAPVLRTPAFSFDADARWDELFPQLDAYFKEEGHSRYPTTGKSDLSKFVTHIRSVYRAKKARAIKNDPDADPTTVGPDLSSSKLLTPERMEALREVNFEFQLWSVDQSQWETRFSELLAYKEKNGHFHVTSKENATLSSWSKTQRQRYKNTMALYQGIYGVEFTSTQKKAEELYEKAKKLAEEAKEAGEEMPTVADVAEPKNCLHPDKIVKLTAVGFEWDLQKDSYVESWENRYLQLLKFKVMHGHCRVPKSSGENPQLGQWVKQMRKYYNWKEEGKPCPATFTQERVDRLNELGFEWRLKDIPGSIVKAEMSEAQAAVAAAHNQDPDMPIEVDVSAQGHSAEGSGSNKSAVRLDDLIDGARYEPFRANVSMYEQRGWL